MRIDFAQLLLKMTVVQQMLVIYGMSMLQALATSLRLAKKLETPLILLLPPLPPQHMIWAMSPCLTSLIHVLQQHERE